MNRIRVKVCGLTRPEDVRDAVRLGADAIGVVLWPDSPRAVTTALAAELTADVPSFVTRVGVFVDQTPADVARAVSEAHLDVAQLHGDEDPADYARVGARLLKAVTVEDDDAVGRAMGVPQHVMLLVDALDPVRRGGTGRVPDWTRAAALARRRPIVLAGGLIASNVAAAIRAVAPAGLDVSSGVEVEGAPGRKDPQRLANFFAAVAAAGQEVA